MTATPQCYGGMFPSVLPLGTNRSVAGKVFSYRVNMPGVAVTSRTMDLDREAWHECVQCAFFEDCYRLSTGRLLLECALR